MSLLTMVQTICLELGLTVPTVVTTSSDQQVRHIAALLNREGKTLCDEADWPKLVKTQTITTVSGTSDYAYPSDFLRMIDGTSWDRTNNWEMLGPDTVLIDRYRRESTTGQVGVRRFFSNTGDGIRIWPPVTVSGDTLVYNYVSKNWAETSSGTDIDSMTADTDVPFLDQELLILGAMARWLDVKGFDSTNAMARYLNRKERRMAQELGGRVMNMEGAPEDPFLSITNVPDSGYALG